MSKMSSIFNSTGMMRLRVFVASFRRHYDPFYRWRLKRRRERLQLMNLPYERGTLGLFFPQIMGLEETLHYIADRKCSFCRYGDGEFALMDKRKMLFESVNERMRIRLQEIIENPIENCLCCVLNVLGSLERYEEGDRNFWREILPWLRPVMERVLRANPQPLGDPQISRPYMTMIDKTSSRLIFDLWKELFARKRLLIVEGRYSRLGVGNDLLSGAASIRRIWCPPTGAFAYYDEILSAIKANVNKDEMVVLALGATATILAYDLAKLGYWAIDAGHVDVEYMWMIMGATRKVVIPGRYVSEVVGGQKCSNVVGEESMFNVIKIIGENV